MTLDSAPQPRSVDSEGLDAPDALVAMRNELRLLEHRLSYLHGRLTAVPVQRDTIDGAELAVEHLLADMAQALHKLLLARMTAEHGCRLIGRL